MATAAPPWETIVNDVVMNSNYHQLTTAADLWRSAFKQVDDLRERLEHLSKTSAETWKGGGAEAFRAHVQKLVGAVRTTADAHRTVAMGLDACAAHLRDAFRAIRVPEHMYADVQAKQRTVSNGGRVDGYPPGAFLVHFELEHPGADLEAAKEFFKGYEQQAQQAYLLLCERYRNTLAQIMPKGTPVAVPAARADVAKSNGTSRPGANTPATRSPLSTAQLPQGLTTPTTPTTPTPPTFDPPSLPGPSAPNLPDPIDFGPKPVEFGPLKPVKDTGLAGATGDLGGGAPSGGFGGGGGVKVPSLSAPLTVPESITEPVRNIAVPKGRVAAAGSGGGSGGLTGPPMTPMLGGLTPNTGQQSTKDRTTSLLEPSGMFAADDSVPPGVLDG